MRRVRSALAIAGCLLLAGCAAAGAPDDSEAKAPIDTSAEAEQVEVPDVVGLALDVARDTLREAGVEILDEVDVDEGRSVWSPSNWTVVEQTYDTDGVILGVTNHADAQRDAEREESAATDAERSAKLEAELKAALGVEQFSELFVSDPSLWGGWITGVRVERANATITLQVSADDPLRDDLGERAARALTTLLSPEALDGISWIIVEDASGVVIAQEMT